MSSLDASESSGSFYEDLEWELAEGIPQFEDPFIQKYLQGREALIEQEKKQRHDYLFKATMSPLAREAGLIMSKIRKRELELVWTSEYEESLAQKNGGNLYPGMMFSLARERMEDTLLWKILEKMPKGALLHAHLDAMIDIDWLIEQAFTEPGFHILAPQSLHDEKSREFGPIQFRYYEATPKGDEKSIWSSDYISLTPTPVKVAAAAFPGGEDAFKKWLTNRCLITPEESLNHHHGVNAIWRKFTSTFPTIDWIFGYEPIFRRAIQRLLAQLASDGITYIDFRMAFMWEYRLQGQTNGEQFGLEAPLQAFGEEIEKFKKTERGAKFKGARMICTAIRSLDNKTIIPRMKEFIRVKKAHPHLISGFDFVSQEDKGRPLADLIPLVFWFKKKCFEEGVEMPFFFHAGECLGDGNSTDNNLFDAILLGTRRIGHGYSLYKHPLLVDLVKQKKILIESCPISNEVLRLSSSILSHSLPALLSRGVTVSLNNDDPAILGHGKNGLSHDFWQTFMAFENLGLEGLATMAENSLKWCAVEDRKNAEWIKDIEEGYMGKGLKADMLKEWRSDFEKFCQWVIIEFPEEGGDDEEDGDEEDFGLQEELDEGGDDDDFETDN